MRILVTGANGFVGRALTAHLVAHGHTVVGAMRQIPHGAAGVPGMVAVGDVGPTTDWTAAVEEMDAVVHLAARVHLLNDTAADAMAQYRRVNVEGTRGLAAAAARAGVRRLVLLSSAKVHGERSTQPFTERHQPQPEDAYGLSKFEGEKVLEQVLAQSPTQWTILRPPLIYGPAVRANFLRLLRTIDTGLPLPLAACDNRRSLVYIGNLIDATRVCLEHPGAVGETFLIADGEDLSSPELIRRLARALHGPARLWPAPLWLLRLGGALTGKMATVERLVDSLQVDASAIRAKLGWTPPYTVDQGLQETARWFRQAAAGQP